MKKNQVFRLTNRLNTTISMGVELETIGPINMKGDIDNKRILEIILTREKEDFEYYFPEYIPTVFPIYEEYETVINIIQRKYNEIWNLNQAQYAIEAKKEWYSKTLLAMRLGKYFSAKEFFGVMGYNTFKRFLDLYHKTEN